VGKAVHKGLEMLLRTQIGSLPPESNEQTVGWFGEEHAVKAALADFATHRSALALDLAEESALAAALDPKDAGFNAQLVATATELGMSPDDPALADLLSRQRNSAAEFDVWLWQEQAALVEGMVRAYARRRLRPLLEEFEALEVEREGDWELAAWDHQDALYDIQGLHLPAPTTPWSLRFMSRPDALLRSRADNSLYLLSFKTAATWDVRKARDAEHDMQGLSEGVEVEKRLGEWWGKIHGIGMWGAWANTLPDPSCSAAMYKFLHGLPSPPRILGIRYEYLLKGSRYADKDLSARFGLNVWAQRSHLIRAYANDAGQWCWSYDFLKDDGSTSKLYYKSWRPHAVWESMPMRQWIDLLDSSTEAMSAYDSTVGAEPRPLGWHSDAQAQGYTSRHPLDEVFPAPLTVYRSDDALRDFVDQIEHQERRVAESVAAVESTEGDAGERRHQLNVHFPMARRSCSYPTECAFTRVCYGGEDAQRDPLATGAFKPRTPNHPQEAAVTP
jgi:hypothetical protein